MRLSQALLGLVTGRFAQPDHSDMNVSAPNASPTLGSSFNYWTTPDNWTTWDLTRSQHLPVTSPKRIPMLGRRKEAIIEPSRTAMVIVDMQNFFLHPQLSPHATAGRLAVQSTLGMIKSFRHHGMKILWVNWGIDPDEATDLPPSSLDGFSSNHSASTSFCADMGTLTEDDGTVIALGEKLCRGSWNARPWGPLDPTMEEGVGAGTDLYFHKNRLSGLWGAQTPLSAYLQESQTTTLFIGGVNSDQCVFTTLIGAYFRGYDVVYVEDCAATVSPWANEEMVRYNVNLEGFLANSTFIIKALEKQES